MDHRKAEDQFDDPEEQFLKLFPILQNHSYEISKESAEEQGKDVSSIEKVEGVSL